MRANTLQFARVTDKSLENATKVRSDFPSSILALIIVGHDRRDRFVEAQTARNTRALSRGSS